MWQSTFLCLLLFLFLHHYLSAAVTTSAGDDFTLNGFRGANLTLDGTATITSNGLLRLTNNTKQVRGHAFHPSQIQFRPLRHNGTVFSFSTTFVFATILKDQYIGGNGLTFFISGSDNFSSALGSHYLGLFNLNNNGNSTNHVFAIELDTIFNPDIQDSNNNHVGIDVNSVVSNFSVPAGYFSDDTGVFQNLSLLGEQIMQAWVEYDAESMQLNVTLAPVPTAKPRRPLISRAIDLSPVFLDSMFVGFSASTGSFRTAHYVLGWSFKINGTARVLDYSLLPSLPRTKSDGRSKLLEVGIPLASAGVVLAIAGVVALVVRRMKHAELLEDWEREYGPHRFSYKDLFDATGGFAEENSLGDGGFGRVYRGVLWRTKLDVAVKRVSHESRQGMKEFIAEIVSLGHLRHRNLVRLLGYCRRKGELLLVYDYMPNGSLDKLLYDRLRPCLDWPTRFKIIKGVASGLLYLHEDWEQMVIHRDIKASNVLLDSEMNGRLGDFGLARLYDHGNDPQTTHIVGTMGYMAPELMRTGRASAATDVFAFGTFLLEVACGRRPVDWAADIDQIELLEWVLESWRKGSILETRDARLGEEFVAEEDARLGEEFVAEEDARLGEEFVAEVELVLKLGLLCAHQLPAARPSMRRVVEYLEGSSPLPELAATSLSFKTIALEHSKSFEDYMTYPSSSSVATAASIA